MSLGLDSIYLKILLYTLNDGHSAFKHIEIVNCKKQETVHPRHMFRVYIQKIMPFMLYYQHNFITNTSTTTTAMNSTKIAIFLLAFCLTVALSYPFCLVDQVESSIFYQVSDRYFKNYRKDVKRLFGYKHMSSNNNSRLVSQAKPIAWGQNSHILVMLDVKHIHPKCTLSRNVLFVINPTVPYTVVSPYVAKTLYKDCNITGDSSNIGIKINGRELVARVYKHQSYGVNLLGMDFMTEHNVEFSMKLNKDYSLKSQLTFKFDSKWEQ